MCTKMVEAPQNVFLRQSFAHILCDFLTNSDLACINEMATGNTDVHY